MFDDLLKNIKEIRKAKGYTQTELAEKIGVKLRQVQRWEAGEVYPEKKHLDKIVEVLGIAFKRHIDEQPKIISSEPNWNNVLLHLTESNRILAESNKIAIENNSKLVETNSRLVDRLLNLEKSFSGPDQTEDESLLAELYKKHGVRDMEELDKAFSDMPANVQKLADKKKRS